MPTSYRENIPQILDIIEEVNPKTILDIGCGRGKFGHLVREYFPTIEIDAMEVFEPYITPAHRQHYGKVYIGNAIDGGWTQEAFTYDLILLVDVIEHWPKDKAREWVDKVLALGTKILVSTPIHDIKQGSVYGNDWEAHISHWGGWDFERWPHKAYANELSHTYLLGV